MNWDRLITLLVLLGHLPMLLVPVRFKLVFLLSLDNVCRHVQLFPIVVTTRIAIVVLFVSSVPGALLSGHV